MTFKLRYSAGVLGTVMLMLAASGCGSEVDAGTEGASETQAATSPSVAGAVPLTALDPAAKRAVQMPSIDSVDPQFPIADPGHFATIVLGKVVEFREGPSREDYPGDPGSSPGVVVQIETTAVLQGDEKAGDSVYVRLAMSDLAGLEKAIPPGTLALMAVQPVDPAYDEYLVNPWAGVPEGATRYIAGAAYAAFADGADATWYPMLETTYPQPIQDLVPASMKSLLGDALQNKG